MSALISANGIFEACLLKSEPDTSCGALCVIRLMCHADDEDDSSSDGQCGEAVRVPPLEERSHVLGLSALGWCPASETHCDSGPDADMA